MSYDTDYISMHLPEKFEIREMMTDAFTFKPSGKKRVIRDRQKRTFKALMKDGSMRHHMERIPVMNVVHFHKGQAADYIIKKAGALLFRKGVKPTRVLVGRKQFEELAGNVLPADCGRFDFGLDYRTMTSSREFTASPYASHVNWNSAGINVEVVPWMDGVLVL